MAGLIVAVVGLVVVGLGPGLLAELGGLVHLLGLEDIHHGLQAVGSSGLSGHLGFELVFLRGVAGGQAETQREQEEEKVQEA